MENMNGRPSANGYVQLPFIIVNTNRKTVIDCSISHDKMEYMLNFNDKFEIHDDMYVLKQIGLLMGIVDGTCTSESVEKVKSILPKMLHEYVDSIVYGNKNLENTPAGPSNSKSFLLDQHLDDESSRQSSSNDPLSPSQVDAECSDEDLDSEISSDD